MTAWRKNEEVTESGSSANHNNTDGMKLDGNTPADALGTATVIMKDEEMPYATGNGFKPVGDGTGMTDKQGMKLEGDSDDSEPMNRDVDDANNKE